MNHLSSQPAKTIPCLAMPKMSAPTPAPIAEPYPPVSRQPPMTAAMMNWNSSPTPWSACADFRRSTCMEPTSAAVTETVTNSATCVRAAGTPTLRATIGLPPAAKIQLPARVRSSTQVATAVMTSHHRLGMRKSPPRNEKVLANTANAESYRFAKPGRFGADVSHLNLHKTFCIPVGGGGDNPIQPDRRTGAPSDCPPR